MGPVMLHSGNRQPLPVPVWTQQLRSSHTLCDRTGTSFVGIEAYLDRRRPSLLNQATAACA